MTIVEVTMVSQSASTLRLTQYSMREGAGGQGGRGTLQDTQALHMEQSLCEPAFLPPLAKRGRKSEGPEKPVPREHMSIEVTNMSIEFTNKPVGQNRVEK